MYFVGVSTDPPNWNVWFRCLAALECILDVVRALPLGSCLPSDGQSGGSSPSSPASGTRRPPSLSEEEQIQGMPGKMFLNGATSAASLFTQRGRKGINQDAMLVWEVCLISSLCYLDSNIWTLMNVWICF